MHMLGSLPYGGTEYSRAEKASGTTQGRRATARDSGQLSAVMVALVFAALSQGRGKPAPLQRLAVRRLPLFQLERLVQRPHRLSNLLLVDQAGDADLARRDQLDVDPGLEQRPEHAPGVARGRSHACANDAHLRQMRVRQHVRRFDLQRYRLHYLERPAQVGPRDGEREVRKPLDARILYDRVDADPVLAERLEQRSRDARTVGNAANRNAGDVHVLRDRHHPVALLHERSSVYQCTRRVAEAGGDVDWHSLHRPQLHGARVHNLRPIAGQLQHLLVADHGELPRLLDGPRVCVVDTLDVGIDFGALGAESRRQRHRRRVRAAAPQRGDVLFFRYALEPGDDHDPPHVKLLLDPLWLYAMDARPAVASVSADARLCARKRDGGLAGMLERHRQQRRRHDLAG